MRERQQQGGGDGSELERSRSGGVRDLGLPGVRLGQMLDDLFGSSALGSTRGGWPAVDIDESEDAYCVCMEIPGVRREDLEVDMEGGMVTVRGEKRRSEETGRARWSERSYGAFVRSFSLPSEVDPEQASATFEDGVLTLKFPKRESARPRRIEIQSGRRGSNGSGAERASERGESQSAS
ncbi:MAG: heat-shock protein Hsp20 [Proteobacteria bacterium]|nr:MAG: heat-shock protein Hsp20 [Pseudomonadota bacterium]